MTATTDDPQIPPPPGFALDIDLGDDEQDVDRDLLLPNDGASEEQVLSRDTLPLGLDHLGTYPSLELYFRAQLEPEISRGCQWILGCLDWTAVQLQFEADGSRLFCESGEVYRISQPEPDHAGPWMPTRGA